MSKKSNHRIGCFEVSNSKWLEQYPKPAPMMIKLLPTVTDLVLHKRIEMRRVGGQPYRLDGQRLEQNECKR
ncbi:MAG: hypothetical protein H0S82_00565 [Anaerolineaceae bacterium]|nr:hypothetical protein [Anaerolineaceae bacterium]